MQLACPIHVHDVVQGLAIYGNGFCSKFEAAACPNALLDAITLVDTPGVLSGEKQRIERTYDFIEVCGWFAARCDLVSKARVFCSKFAVLGTAAKCVT
jgi:hypothetical protein